jgi:hypothetical protein
MLSAIVLPGPSYLDVLARVHATLRPETYLEIGVDAGATLSLAVGAAQAVGVDPAPSPSARAIPRGARCYRLESDVFFARESRASVFGVATVDLAFVDGLHRFEQALRDFVNVERWCGRASTVVLHDCLPPAAIAASRERTTLFWVGDVWKVLEALLDHRSDLRITVVPAPPSGLVIVRGLDPSSTVLADRMDEIVARYRDAPYPFTPGDWPARYRVVGNDAEGLASALTP